MSKALKPKGDGQSLMVSDFLSADWGRLHDDKRCILPMCHNTALTHSSYSEAHTFFKPGKNRDGWFLAKELLTQLDTAIDIFEGLTKGWAHGLFLFDNALSHQKHTDNAHSVY